MNAEIYAEWLRHQGHRILRSASSWWHSEGWGVYQAFPHHWLIHPEKTEIRELMRHALALRYSMPPREGTHAAHHIVFTSGEYGMGNLSARPRKNLRRALRGCTVEPISFPVFLAEGWALRVDTLERQRRKLNESREKWRRRFESAADLPGFEIWGAKVEGKLAATLVVFRMDDWYYLISQQSGRRYLRAMVNNALAFSVTQVLSRRAGVQGIFYGMRPLEGTDGVDEFKLHLGYRRRMVFERIAFHPLLAPMVNRFTHAIVKVAARLNPASRAIRKTEGMLRLGCNSIRSANRVAEACSSTSESC